MKRTNAPRDPFVKVFCIGFGKTGTTSIGVALKMLGFKMGSQPKGERLLDSWATGDFSAIIEHCRSAEAFQDIPFFLPRTYEHLDHAYPGSKFILTVRNSSDEWYQSLVRFHLKIFRSQTLPTADALKTHRYRHKGWIWKAHELIYEVDERSLFSRRHYIEKYESHYRNVTDYFKGRDHSLLVLNLSHPDAMQSLCRFLDRPHTGQAMPHRNSSKRSLLRNLKNTLFFR